ncbi:MAG: hypothetical protein MK066_06935 [Crocinitomicaceae bacterium]|nr:hypothetical protein [Crocinitomicaceae bacterium]
MIKTLVLLGVLFCAIRCSFVEDKIEDELERQFEETEGLLDENMERAKALINRDYSLKGEWVTYKKEMKVCSYTILISDFKIEFEKEADTTYKYEHYFLDADEIILSKSEAIDYHLIEDTLTLTGFFGCEDSVKFIRRIPPSVAVDLYD